MKWVTWDKVQNTNSRKRPGTAASIDCDLQEQKQTEATEAISRKRNSFLKSVFGQKC